MPRPTIKDFRDPTRYVKVPDRNVFDEGEVRYFDKVFDDDGNPVIDPKTGKQKLEEVVWSVNKEVLERIAAINNARNEAGDLSPISIGHNDLRNPDERSQPPLVGIGGDYKVAWDDPHQKWMLRADYYIRREDFDEAKTYPFTSIELHPSDGAIHPISLIRRAPKKDLGAWIFSRDGKSCHQAVSRFDSRLGRRVTVLRYSRDLPDTEMSNMIDQPNDNPVPPEEDHVAKTQQYMRDVFPHLHHITQHPFHADMVKQYAANLPGDDDDPAPVGEPNANAAADAETPPVQNAATFPNSTNACMPGDKKDKEPMQNARTPNAAPPTTSPVPAAAPAKEPSQFARDIQAQQYSRLAEVVESQGKVINEIKELLQTKDRDSAQALHFSRCEKGVQDLIHKHNRIVEDPDAVLARLKLVSPDKLDEEVLFFAKSLPYDIGGRREEFVRTPATLAMGGNDEPDEDPVTGQLSPRRASQVLAYQRDHNLWDDPEKAKKDCPKNYRLSKPFAGDAPRRG